MVRILILSACALLGIAIASVLAGLNKRPLKWLINMFSCALLVSGGFACAVYAYTRLAHTKFSFGAVFSDKVSLLIGMYLFLIFSIVIGILVGAVSSGGMTLYISRFYKSKVFTLTGVFVLALTVSVSCLCAYPLVSSSRKVNVVINEVCQHNFNLICDAEENYYDYIELYNAGDVYVDLSTLYISDSPEEKEKYRLPEYYMAPGEYILIWANGADKGYENGAIHANFRLSDNETVILSNSYKKIVDTVSLPFLPDNVTVTRLDRGFVYAYGTPLKSNESCVLYTVPTLSSPVFSVDSGFYTEDVLLEITSSKGSDIFYTTDGSVPDENSIRYTGAITLTDVTNEPNRIINVKNTVYGDRTVEVVEEPVEKANIIRAIAINKKGEISNVVTGTYFVGEAAKKYEGCSIMSVIADPDDLFGDKGICVTGPEYDKWFNETDRSTACPDPNFMRHGKMWEREAVIQLWDETGDLILDQSCGMRVQGNTSRIYAIKRFSFYARENYSDSRYFDAPIFSGRNNVHSIYTKSEGIDYVVSSLAEDRELATQDGLPVIMFLDGELYNITYLREKHDSDYFYDLYGIPEEELVVVSESGLDEGTYDDLVEYNDFIKYLCEQDAADPAIYAVICKKMDVQSFIDFMAVSLYCNNIDISLSKNLRMWRVRTAEGDGYLDGRWRFALYDTDAVEWAFAARTDTEFLETDPFRWTLKSDKYPKEDQKYIIIPFLENLLKNESFRHQFVLTYLDVANETFSINGSGKKIVDAIGESDNKFIDDLLRYRAPWAIGFLKNALDITADNCSVYLSTDTPEGGGIRINTVIADTTTDGVWTGEYISGYTVTVTAIPEEGYRFAGWEGDISSDEETITTALSKDGLTLKAIFEKEGDN